jgi:hypothetical protein
MAPGVHPDCAPMDTLEISDYWKPDGPELALFVIHEPDYRQQPMEHLAAAAGKSLRTWADVYGHGVNLPPAFLADFGTITMAKPWGGRIEISNDGFPFIHPAAQSIDEALEIEPAENPDLEAAVRLYREVRAASGIADPGFKTPDFQGVLNTAALVVDQTALFMAMLDEPDKVHAFLDRVCTTNIRFMQTLRADVGRADGNIWPYIWLPGRFGVGITEDMMPLLGVDEYREFGIPYLRRIADELGGVFIHCCGEWARHAPTLAESGIRIRGMEHHHPFTRFEEVRDALKGVVFVPYFAGFKSSEFPDYVSYVRHLLGQRRPGDRIAITITDSPDWKASELAQIVQAAGGIVPRRVVDSTASSEAV